MAPNTSYSNLKIGNRNLFHSGGAASAINFTFKRSHRRKIDITKSGTNAIFVKKEIIPDEDEFSTSLNSSMHISNGANRVMNSVSYSRSKPRNIKSKIMMKANAIKKEKGTEEVSCFTALNTSNYSILSGDRNLRYANTAASVVNIIPYKRSQEKKIQNFKTVMNTVVKKEIIPKEEYHVPNTTIVNSITTHQNLPTSAGATNIVDVYVGSKWIKSEKTSASKNGVPSQPPRRSKRLLMREMLKSNDGNLEAIAFIPCIVYNTPFGYLKEVEKTNNGGNTHVAVRNENIVPKENPDAITVSAETSLVSKASTANCKRSRVGKKKRVSNKISRPKTRATVIRKKKGRNMIVGNRMRLRRGQKINRLF